MKLPCVQWRNNLINTGAILVVLYNICINMHDDFLNDSLSDGDNDDVKKDLELNVTGIMWGGQERDSLIKNHFYNLQLNRTIKM